MTRILVTKWLWQGTYSDREVEETEKYKPERYIVGSGNVFEDVHVP